VKIYEKEKREKIVIRKVANKWRGGEDKRIPVKNHTEKEGGKHRYEKLR
jgi:hypothetical protein